MALRVDPRSDIAPSRQIVEAILDDLASGSLRAADRLESVRSLAGSALVNPNTVGKAYRDLETMGVVEGRNGSGVYVTGRGASIARSARRAATLDAFRRAAAAALRAGHDAAAIEGELADAIDAATEPARVETKQPGDGDDMPARSTARAGRRDR